MTRGVFRFVDLSDYEKSATVHIIHSESPCGALFLCGEVLISLAVGMALVAKFCKFLKIP